MTPITSKNPIRSATPPGSSRRDSIDSTTSSGIYSVISTSADYDSDELPPDSDRLCCFTRPVVQRGGGLILAIGGAALGAVALIFGWPIWAGVGGVALVMLGVWLMGRPAPDIAGQW